MFPEVAPKHVHNFDSLVSIQFYNGTAFHRVIPNFMIQGGDPNSRDKAESTWGYGDPSQTKVPAEFSSKPHLRGILSAARLGNDINSATSQFFICVANVPQLDGQYTIYGEVIEGMDVADNIVNVPRNSKDLPNEKVEMTIIKLEPNQINDYKAFNPEIIIYPNPVDEVIYFKPANENMKIQSLQITGIDGSIIRNINYTSAVSIGDISIPSNELSQGIYLIRLTDSFNKVYDLKVVVN